MFHYSDLKKRICLTCQYFNTERQVQMIGRSLVIAHSGKGGTCRLFQNFPHPFNASAQNNNSCRYSRWVDLPELNREN